MTGYEPNPELIEAVAKVVYVEASRLGLLLGTSYCKRCALSLLAVVVPLIREQIAAEDPSPASIEAATNVMRAILMSTGALTLNEVDENARAFARSVLAAARVARGED